MKSARPNGEVTPQHGNYQPGEVRRAFEQAMGIAGAG
jgi:hypothetical protein